MVTAARTFAWQEAGQVAGSIAQQRHSLAVDSCDDQFAEFTVGYRLQRDGVDDFNDEVVFPDVQPVLLLTFEGHAWTHHLRDTVGVVGFHAEVVLDTLALFLAVRLGSYAEHAQLGVTSRVDAFLFHHLVDT